MYVPNMVGSFFNTAQSVTVTCMWVVFVLQLLLKIEYGSVICDGVEMADIPTELQEARVFKLHLRNNGLHRFPDAKLQGTGNFFFS